MVGTVVSCLYGKYKIYSNNKLLNDVFTLKGSFNKDKLKVIAGDLIEYNPNDFTIYKRYDRRSYLKRPEVANLDYLIIVSSLNEPTFSYDLLFKYLTYANANNINSIVVLTKKDLADAMMIKDIETVLTKLGVKHFFVSNKTKEGLDEIKSMLKGRIFCLMGQSGVGKSSLINSIDSGFNRLIGEYSSSLGRGKHKTKETILLPYNDGFIVDTPGFSSLELNLTKIEIAHFFIGFDKYYTNCPYFDCLHISEKDCPIKKAVHENKIPKICYDSYIKLINEIDSNKKR